MKIPKCFCLVFTVICMVWCPSGDVSGVQVKGVSQYSESTGRLALLDRVVDESMRFSGWNTEGQFVFQTPDNRQLPVEEEQLVWWIGVEASPVQSLIRLIDDSIVAGHVGILDVDRLSVSSSVWQPADIPRRSVKGVLFHLAEDSVERDQWMKRLGEVRVSDRVWMIDGDFIEGTVVEMVDRRKLVLRTGDSVINIPLERIAAITFRQADEDQDHGSTTGNATAEFEYSFTDGSRLKVSGIRVVDNRIYATLAGVNLELGTMDQTVARASTARLVTGIRNIRFDSDYLGQMKPIDYRHQPLVGQQASFRINRSVAGNEMRHQAANYPLGIGMPSRASLVFRIEEPVRAFQFGLAIDETSGGQGSVICGVLALDEKNRWEKVWSSTVIRGGDPVAFETVSIVNARAIALTVDYADRGDVMDRVNWLMPRLVR